MIIDRNYQVMQDELGCPGCKYADPKMLHKGPCCTFIRGCRLIEGSNKCYNRTKEGDDWSTGEFEEYCREQTESVLEGMEIRVEKPKRGNDPTETVMRYMIKVQPDLKVEIIPPKRTMITETFEGLALAGVVDRLFKRVPAGCTGRLIFELIQKN